MFLIEKLRSRRVDTGRCTTSNPYRKIRVFKEFTQFQNYIQLKLCFYKYVIVNASLFLPRQSDDNWQLETSFLDLVTRIYPLDSDL